MKPRVHLFGEVNFDQHNSSALRVRDDRRDETMFTEHINKYVNNDRLRQLCEVFSVPMNSVQSGHCIKYLNEIVQSGFDEIKMLSPEEN